MSSRILADCGNEDEFIRILAGHMAIHQSRTTYFAPEMSFRDYLDSTLVERPYYCNVREGIELTTDDRILTLSTCMNGGGNVRYLVQGVLVDEQYTE